jgi:hypothetical protein
MLGVPSLDGSAYLVVLPVPEAGVAAAETRGNNVATRLRRDTKDVNIVTEVMK